ncbi:MAG: glycosyltransferase family 2 protein [Candidatus Cloacimonetes bacterium]|nr:glycosyltransferase family 2 protein [Candidatus Cloacimonadota bacterium]
MKSFIGIIHFGSDELIYKLVASLNHDKEDLVCVLNHNQKNTLKNLDDNIDIVHDPRNLGFSIGMNHLLKHSLNLGYDRFIGINNDMVLVDDSLEKMKSSIHSNNVVQGTLVNEEGLVLSCRNKINPTFFWVKSIDRHKHVSFINNDKTDFVCGGYFGIDLRYFKENPVYFDEDFFMYHEDVEWSKRLVCNGYYLQVSTDAQAIHYESSSTGGKISLLGIQYRWSSLLVLLKKTQESPLYNILSIISFIMRMAFVWTKYGFRLR